MLENSSRLGNILLNVGAIVSTLAFVVGATALAQRLSNPRFEGNLLLVAVGAVLAIGVGTLVGGMVQRQRAFRERSDYQKGLPFADKIQMNMKHLEAADISTSLLSGAQSTSA